MSHTSSEVETDSESMSSVECESGGESENGGESESGENAGTIQPYQFEPDASDSDDIDDEEAEETVNDRMDNLDWCTCGHCQIMDRNIECVCCQETETMITKCHEAVAIDNLPEPPPCITQHSGFKAVCLNHWVLQTAWYQYRQQYDEPYDGPEHKKNRHVAYRQLARWCWGFLGRHVRVPLPACAVCCIRAHFPPPGYEEEFVYQGYEHGQ